MRKTALWAVPAILIGVASCTTPNDVAMQVGEPPKLDEGKTTVDLRVLQSRRFDTLEETKLLSAATQTLQDLGFTITESSAEVGVLVGSKQRDAEEGAQIAGQVMLSLVLAALGSYYQPVWDKDQSINVTLVSSPVENSSQTEVRVTFDRRLTNNHGRLWKTELLLEPELYQQFFEKFAASAFLEAHEL